MEDKAIRGVPWTLLGFGVSRGISVVTTLVLARLVAPSDFGLMFIGLVLVNFLFWFGGLSLGSTLILCRDLDRRGGGTVLLLVVAFAVIAPALALALAPLVGAPPFGPRAAGVLCGPSPAGG